MKNNFNILVLFILFIPITIYSQYALAGDIYFKGTIGYGIISEKISTGIDITMEDGTINDIYITPGGGKNIGWGMGLHISSTVKTEMDISYQYSGERFSNGTVLFRKFPAGIVLVKEYQRNESYLLYGKMGLMAIFTPKYFDELNGSKLNIDYRNSYAGQISIGIMRRIESEKVYYFVEGKYVFGKNLKWKSANLDEVDTTPSPTFESLNSNGLFLNIGIGYYY